jgi:hypothetical protein
MKERNLSGNVQRHGEDLKDTGCEGVNWNQLLDIRSSSGFLGTR